MLVYDYSTTGPARAQVIRIPNYSSVTVESGGTLRANAWDGATGGVVMFRASGAVTVAAGGVLYATGLGPSGGAPGSASSVLSNGNVAGQGGAADWIGQHCGVYEDTGQIGACDSCDHGPCQEIRGGNGTAAYAGIGSPVPGGSVARGCVPNWCYGGYGGAGGQDGPAGAAGNGGSPAPVQVGPAPPESAERMSAAARRWCSAARVAAATAALRASAAAAAVVAVAAQAATQPMAVAAARRGAAEVRVVPGAAVAAAAVSSS